jgi:nucleoid DNA-binding protein
MLKIYILLILTNFGCSLINQIPVNISPLIRELLLIHEKIVIPGFGTFTLSHRPAEINKTTGFVNPPSKDILFDDRKKTDDGELAGSIMQKHQLTREEAAKSINLFVKSAEEQLRLAGTTTIEGIGYLGRDKSGKYSFKPMKELVSRINIFELPKLDIPVTRTVTPRTINPKPYVPPVVTDTEEKRRWWIPLTIVAVLAGLSALVYFTGLYQRFTSREPVVLVSSDDSDEEERLVFGNRDSSGTDTAQERISRELDQRTAREEALLYEEAEKKPAEVIERPAPEPVSPVVPVISEKGYHIIAGAFEVESNAIRQKARLEKKGFSPVLLPKRGNFYMVSLGSFDSKGQATAALSQMKERLDQELWVTRIK